MKLRHAWLLLFVIVSNFGIWRKYWYDPQEVFWSILISNLSIWFIVGVSKAFRGKLQTNLEMWIWVFGPLILIPILSAIAFPNFTWN
jgi:hypothetical protein